MDRNHNYDSAAKFAHRARVFDRYYKQVLGRNSKSRKSPDTVCVTLPSCVHGRKEHKSYDIEQWSRYFGDMFIGVNRDKQVGRVFKRMHPNSLFFHGDAYETFARLAPFHKGMYYLDSTNTMDYISNNASVLASLGRFLLTAKPSTMLALNMAYNRRIIGELPDASRADIRAKIKTLLSGLPIKGWQTSRIDFDAYRSTEQTLMVTVFFIKKRSK